MRHPSVQPQRASRESLYQTAYYWRGSGLHSPFEADSDPTGPPHSPPADDHSTLWLDDKSGEPAIYSIHLYLGNVEWLDSQEPPHNLWFDIFGFAAEWGLEVSILPKSWYNLGSTVQVIFYPPERYR